MKRCSTKTILLHLSMVLLLAMPGVAAAQGEPSECVEMGALAYDNWTKEDSGGIDSLLAGAVDSDYVRCKACHAWDHMATDGGYVRCSRNEGRSNAGAGDGDVTNRNISFAAREEGEMVTAEMIWHEDTGRAYSEGKASWVELDADHSASNKADHSNGYTLGNQHPDFSVDGMTQEQVDCLAEFLNFADADPSTYFSDINPSQDPVLYTIVNTADAEMGETLYEDRCDGCHEEPSDFVLGYLAQDGKFSEFSHKVRWGIPDTSMTREAIGSPSSVEVADIMLYLQELGGTGFAMNPGLTGNWWNGPARDGEGFLLEIGYSNDALTIFASLYTYDGMGNQVWLIAIGPVSGNKADVDVFITEGRFWGDSYDPAEGSTTQWGSGIFTFTSCSSGQMSFVPNMDMQGEGFTDLAYDLRRDLLVPGVACPTPE